MKKEKMDLIEDLLSRALPLLSENEYLNLIEGNDALRLYDEISSKVENNEYPVSYLNEINDDDLDIIIAYLKEATSM